MPFGERTVGYVALQKQHLSFILRPATTRTTTTTTTYTHEQPLTEMQVAERQEKVSLLYLIKRQQSALLSSLSRVNEIEERPWSYLSLLWRARDRGRYRQTHRQLSLFCAGASASARRLYRAGGTAQSQASDVCSDRSVCLFSLERSSAMKVQPLAFSLYLSPLLVFSFDLS
ncbi:hypothetical protein PROFUN_04324 [Planoprotostelium fungivorum]|uniref:Uncharacterized protein n=1 Tax=Planoprotostelium fungivorum TaxID=1890364 RepID=A0A2P6NV92_9EUKA|nr:hypothetical protein PROFUN_04324 [Planoprotostelium fungivorum]